MIKQLHTDTFFRAGVAVILYNKETKNVLVGKRLGNDSKTKGTWQFPQGGIEHNQTVMEAAMTEVFEETGLVITPDDLISDMPGFLTAYEIPGESDKCGRSSTSLAHLRL